MIVLPCLRLWNNDSDRSECNSGASALTLPVKNRFSEEGLRRFFGPAPLARAGKLIALSGGHFRDLLLLLRETVLRTDALPTGEEAIDRAIVRVRSNFLPISIEDAKWLADIERERVTLLKTTDAVEVNRLTRFLDTHVVLYLKNGTEWYDVHPLVRDEVKEIVARAAAVATT